MASTGEIDSAIEFIRRQLAERPSDPEAQKQLGLLLLQAGRPASAIAALRAARDRSPQDIQLGAILAETLIDLGQADGALALGREMIAAAPRSAGPHLLMGAILRRLGRLEEAMQACRQAVDRAPVQAATLNALGASLLELDRLEEAEPVLRRAVTADPGLAPAARHLGGCLKRLGRPEEAEAAFRAALAGSPDPRSRAELGATLLHQGRFPEARAELEAAIAGDPECVEARIGLAHLTLLLGEYETGLPLLEWRDRLRPAPAPFPQPLWRGEPLAGKTILLHGEQGFGDTIQYLRYVPEIARRAGRVVLVVQGELPRHAGREQRRHRRLQPARVADRPGAAVRHAQRHGAEAALSPGRWAGGCGLARAARRGAQDRSRLGRQSSQPQRSHALARPAPAGAAGRHSG